MGGRYAYDAEKSVEKLDQNQPASQTSEDLVLEIAAEKSDARVITLHIDDETVELLLDDRTSTGG